MSRGSRTSGDNAQAYLTTRLLELDLSPNFHPPVSRVPVTFEPKGLDEATGRGAEPPA